MDEVEKNYPQGFQLADVKAQLVFERFAVREMNEKQANVERESSHRCRISPESGVSPNKPAQPLKSSLNFFLFFLYVPLFDAHEGGKKIFSSCWKNFIADKFQRLYQQGVSAVHPITLDQRLTTAL